MWQTVGRRQPRMKTGRTFVVLGNYVGVLQRRVGDGGLADIRHSFGGLQLPQTSALFGLN